MQAILTILEIANALWLYVVLFLAIIMLKKFLHIKVAMNAIWFSEDGDVPEDAILNLIRIANHLKKSAYRKNYQLHFWTDTKKLHNNIKVQLLKHHILIKDYSLAFQKDDLSNEVRAWIHNLLMLGNKNNKLFYVLASDIFRLYLLLKLYPTLSHYAYACYFDCNDINFDYLPNPRLFRQLKKIAFHFVQFNYTGHPIFHKIVPCDNLTQPLLTNDVILTSNRCDPHLFNELFDCYCKNLNVIQHSSHDFISTLIWTLNAMKVIDDDLVRVMIFTTTHMINHLCVKNKNINAINLQLFQAENVQKKMIYEIQNVDDFLSFERDFDKGFTWIRREIVLDQEAVEITDQKNCREFWYSLFQQRYALINE